MHGHFITYVVCISREIIAGWTNLNIFKQRRMEMCFFPTVGKNAKNLRAERYTSFAESIIMYSNVDFFCVTIDAPSQTSRN